MHKKTKKLLPLVAFLYYRNKSSIEDIVRKTKLSALTVHKLINSGIAYEHFLVCDHYEKPYT